MKAPRDILLKRHQAAGPKLDAVRESIVAGLRDGQRVAAQKSRAVDAATLPLLIWRELILPSRRIWAGLAACWVFLVVAHFAMDGRPTVQMAAAVPTPEMIRSYQQQERLLAELIGPIEAQAVDSRKKFLPSPRSGRRFEIVTV